MNHVLDIDHAPDSTSLPDGRVFTFTDAFRRVSLGVCAAGALATGAVLGLSTAATPSPESLAAMSLAAYTTPLGTLDSLYPGFCLLHRHHAKGCVGGSTGRAIEDGASGAADAGSAVLHGGVRCIDGTLDGTVRLAGLGSSVCP
jgi:hypothetical protein